MNRFAHRVVAASSLMLVICLARPAPAAEDYAIKLDRPAKVGDTQRVNFTGSDTLSVVTTVKGQKVQEEKKQASVSLEGEQKAVEVSNKGVVTKYTCLVKKCQLTKDGQTSELVAAGKTIEVSHEPGKEHSHFKIDGADVAPETAEQLNIVLSSGDAEKPTDDDTLGTHDRKKVGDSWDVNKDLIAAEFIKMKLPLQKDGVSGQGKLLEVKPVGDITCEFIEFKMAMPFEKGAHMPDMPQWLSLDSGKIDVMMTKVVPVSPDQEVTAESPEGVLKMTATMNFAGNSPDGAPVSISVTKSMQKQGTTQKIK